MPRDEHGFKGISRLREELKPVLKSLEGFLDNDYHGNYRLNPNVIIGDVGTKALEALKNQVINELAQSLDPALRRRRKG